MGVLCTVRMFQLSQPCPTRWARPRNSLIRNGPRGHRCSLPVLTCPSRPINLLRIAGIKVPRDGTGYGAVE